MKRSVGSELVSATGSARTTSGVGAMGRDTGTVRLTIRMRFEDTSVAEGSTLAMFLLEDGAAFAAATAEGSDRIEEPFFSDGGFGPASGTELFLASAISKMS